MLLQDVLADRFSGMQDGAVHHRAAKGRGQRNDGGDIVGTLAGHRAGNDAAEAMANQVDLAIGVEESLFDVVVESLLDEEVGAFCVEADTGKIRAITNSAQPGMQLCQISVCTQEAGNQHDGRAVAARYAESVVNRRGMQQEDVSGK